MVECSFTNYVVVGSNSVVERQTLFTVKSNPNYNWILPFLYNSKTLSCMLSAINRNDLKTLTTKILNVQQDILFLAIEWAKFTDFSRIFRCKSSEFPVIRPIFPYKRYEEYTWLSLRKKCPYSELFWSAFPAFGLKTERYSLGIQSECGKMREKCGPE